MPVIGSWSPSKVPSPLLSYGVAASTPAQNARRAQGEQIWLRGGSRQHRGCTCSAQASCFKCSFGFFLPLVPAVLGYGGGERGGSQQLFKGFDKLGEQLITWQAVNSCPGAICSPLV